MTEEEKILNENGIVSSGAERVRCSGNACGCVKLKVTQGYPDPPKVKVKNSCDSDVRIKIKWRNLLGAGTTTHEVWEGETDYIDGPPQYWGVESFEANKI